MSSQFTEDISLLKKYSGKFDKSLNKISDCIEKGNFAEAYAESYSMEALSEKMTNLARLTPIATGNKNAMKIISDNITDICDIQVGYNDKGWFEINIPALLPRKEKGNASYIRASLQIAMDKYFSDHTHEKFKSTSVLIFEHIYSKERMKRAYRDHDNIEINVIVDLLALYCMVDDSPMLCKHYYTSKVGDADATHIYIVPYEDFPCWLELEGGRANG